jgi:hypothetical protein
MFSLLEPPYVGCYGEQASGPGSKRKYPISNSQVPTDGEFEDEDEKENEEERRLGFTLALIRGAP